MTHSSICPWFPNTPPLIIQEWQMQKNNLNPKATLLTRVHESSSWTKAVSNLHQALKGGGGGGVIGRLPSTRNDTGTPPPKQPGSSVAPSLLGTWERRLVYFLLGWNSCLANHHKWTCPEKNQTCPHEKSWPAAQGRSRLKMMSRRSNYSVNHYFPNYFLVCNDMLLLPVPAKQYLLVWTACTVWCGVVVTKNSKEKTRILITRKFAGKNKNVLKCFWWGFM